LFRPFTSFHLALVIMAWGMLYTLYLGRSGAESVTFGTVTRPLNVHHPICSRPLALNSDASILLKWA